MTPLQKLEAAATAYVTATEARLRMTRANSSCKDRSAATRRRIHSRAEFERLVAQHPNEIVRLFRSCRRLQEAVSDMMTHPLEHREESYKALMDSKEVLP